MANKMNELRMDIDEFARLLETTERQRVKDILTLEMRRLGTELTKLKEMSENNVFTSERKVPTSVKSCYEVKLTNYAWDQSEKFVKLFVTLKNVQSLGDEKVYCQFTNKSVEMHVKELENRNYVLTINNLLNEIDTSKSYWKVKTDMVVIFLAKSSVGKNWAHLLASDAKAKEPKVPSMNTDPDEDPSAGLMNLMKKMYEEGDDELKRTIAKAWTESKEKNLTGF